ncbi:MAG: helicase associated domain-containing protein, partial [Oscillospiraceae bacterium]|nr:helicase associated domain-containing protein [Oscillospiraceae bacterium]
MVWDDIEAQWQHHFGCAAEFYDKNGHLDVPVNYTSEDGFPLGSWLSQLRTARRGISKRKLTEEQIAQLDAIGMQWGKRGDLLWLQGYRVAEAHFAAYGNLNVPSTYKTPEGFALGKWINRQQYAYNNPGKSNSVLNPERIALLAKIGITL